MKNYDNLFLPTENLEESKKFYSDILGLPVKFDFANQGMIAFKVGNEGTSHNIERQGSIPQCKTCNLD